MDDDVLGFEVSMDDVLAVEVLDSDADLFNDGDGVLFQHGAVGFHEFVELPIQAQFHQ